MPSPDTVAQVEAAAQSIRDFMASDKFKEMSATLRELGKRINTGMDQLNEELNECEAVMLARWPVQAAAIEFSDGKHALVYFRGLFVFTGKHPSVSLVHAPRALRLEAVKLLPELIVQLEFEDVQPPEPPA